MRALGSISGKSVQGRCVPPVSHHSLSSASGWCPPSAAFDPAFIDLSDSGRAKKDAVKDKDDLYRSCSHTELSLAEQREVAQSSMYLAVLSVPPIQREGRSSADAQGACCSVPWASLLFARCPMKAGLAEQGICPHWTLLRGGRDSGSAVALCT